MAIHATNTIADANACGGRLNEDGTLIIDCSGMKPDPKSIAAFTHRLLDISGYGPVLLGVTWLNRDDLVAAQMKSAAAEWVQTQDNANFARFWDAYPKKRDRVSATSAWRETRRSRPRIDMLMDDLRRIKSTAEWVRDDGRWIPSPHDWLMREGWNEAPRDTTEDSIRRRIASEKDLRDRVEQSWAANREFLDAATESEVEEARAEIESDPRLAMLSRLWQDADWKTNRMYASYMQSKIEEMRKRCVSEAR